MADHTKESSMRVALMWILQTQFAGYILAGADYLPGLELIPRRAGRGPIQEVIEARADFAVTSPMHLLAAGENASELVLIGLFMSQSPVRLVGLKDQVGESIEVDRDLRVGVWSGEDTELRAILRGSGVDLGRVEFVSVDEGVPELMSGEVDFVQATTYNEVPAIIKALGDAAAVVSHDPKDWKVDVAKDGLVVRADVLEHRPDDVIALIAASIAGWRAVLAEPRAAAVRVCELVPNLDLVEQQAQLERIVALFDSGHQLGEPRQLELDRAVSCAEAAGIEVNTSYFNLDHGPWEATQTEGPDGG
jgi:ABC-type nitrate/sulfonate/bicarbonate transport system substrate-binding protein